MASTSTPTGFSIRGDPAYAPPAGSGALGYEGHTPLGTLEVPGVDAGQKGTFFDFAVSEALTDGNVDTSDEAQVMSVLRTRHGAGTDALVDDARRAVASLGPQVKDYLEQTGAGNSPGVIQALAQWHRGGFKLSPGQARQRMVSEKDPTMRRLLAMLAARP